MELINLLEVRHNLKGNLILKRNGIMRIESWGIGSKAEPVNHFTSIMLGSNPGDSKGTINQTHQSYKMHNIF